MNTYEPGISPDDLDSLTKYNPRYKALSRLVGATGTPGSSDFGDLGFVHDQRSDLGSWRGSPSSVAFKTDMSAAGPTGDGLTSQPETVPTASRIGAGAGQVLSPNPAKLPPPGVPADSASGPSPAMDLPQGQQGPPPGPVRSAPPGAEDFYRQQARKVVEDAASVEKPEPLKSNWAQRLGQAVLMLSPRVAPYAQQIIHPRWTEQQQAYQLSQKNALDRLKALESAEGTEATSEYRGAIADERKAKAEAILHPTKPTNEWLELKDPVVDPTHPELGPQPAFYNKNDPKQGLVFGQAPVAARPTSHEPKEGELPLGDRIPQLNQLLTSRYQVLHPGVALPPQYQIPAGATQKDYDRIDKSLGAEENATGTLEGRKAAEAARQQGLALVAQAQADRQEAQKLNRSDRSYQFNVGELNRVSKPIEDLAARYSRLKDTIDQNTPQADALIAPELLSVMVGGQGSGLRMTEAEIGRVIGGRSKWQSLEAAVNKWKWDSNAARSITPDQQRQIHDLLKVVSDKLMEKQGIISKARNGLLGTDDPAEHRRIVSEAHQALQGDTINVQLPNGRIGPIHPSRLQEFIQANPGAHQVP